MFGCEEVAPPELPDALFGLPPPDVEQRRAASPRSSFTSLQLSAADVSLAEGT